MKSLIFIVGLFIPSIVCPVPVFAQEEDVFDNDQYEDQEESYEEEAQEGEAQPTTRTSQCDNLNSRIAAPTIQINNESRTKVTGTIEGVCIVDAAYYEEGGRTQRINVSTLPKFKSFPFTLMLKVGKGGELRVHNSRGDSAQHEIEAKNNDDDPLGIGVNPSMDDE